MPFLVGNLLLLDVAFLLTSAALLVGVLAGLGRIRRWIRGRPARNPASTKLANLRFIPHRYLHDVHEVVARDKPSASMHVFAALGFLAGLVILAISVIPAVDGLWLRILALVAAVGGIIGVLMNLRRRSGPTRKRLSGAPYSKMSWALMSVSVLMAAANLEAMGAAGANGFPLALQLMLAGTGAWGLWFLVARLSTGPLKHAFAGALHLAFHPRQARFSKPGRQDVALYTLDLTSDTGVRKAEDFTWPQRLSFDACIQCGRCETVCPAFEAGARLSPKKLIHDLWSCSVGTGDNQSYTGNPYPGAEPGCEKPGSDGPIVVNDGVVSADTIWSCTTCRACVEECPMMIEHIDAVIDLRRHLTMERAEVPNKGPEALDNLRYGGNRAGKPPQARATWALGRSVGIAAEMEEFDLLWWVGETGFDGRGQRTLKAMARLLEMAGVRVAILGEEEQDTGDMARRLGDEATFQKLAKENIATLSKYRFRRIITTDPHVLNVLRNEYPSMGGIYEITHHAQLLLELIEEGALPKPTASSDVMTYHDPCYLGRYNREFDAPRALLQMATSDLVEMARSRERSMCCGGGGGVIETDPGSKKRIPDIRMEHIVETGAAQVAVGCPNCAFMLEGVPGEQAAVRDIAEIVLDAVERTKNVGK